jgi:3-methylcrotonyl-CoA carboxylase alpha subunit
LQVEHPVTEAVTGLDLVEWQLRIAAGEPLPLTQDQVKVHGHAIEARICAESPDNDFLPATGHLTVLRSAAAQCFSTGDVRLDSGVREGDEISPHYDSMIAKLIVHGEDRAQALARLDQALAQLHIVGVANNVAFVRQVLRSKSFAEAQLDTALIEREKAVLFKQQSLPTPLLIAASVAALLKAEQPEVMGWQDPWSRTDSWCLQGHNTRRFDFQHDEEKFQAALTTHSHGSSELLINGQTHNFFAQWLGNMCQLQWGGQRWRAHVYLVHGSVHVFADAGSGVLQWQDPLAHVVQDAAAGGNLSAPMPGKLLSFAVKVGDLVTAGQALAVMEAMKMEHTVASPTAGTVAELLFAPGDQVAEGAPLLRLEVAAA